MLKLSKKEALNVATIAYDLKASNNEWALLEEGDTQCVVKIVNNTAIIGFRGTTNLVDFLADIKALKFEYEDIGEGRFHFGFRSSYQLIRSSLNSFLRRNKIKSVSIFGHSLGGALSLLCAYDLMNSHEYIISQVVTFGCPRVGNRTFQKNYDEHLKYNTVRYVNNNDIVCSVPFLNYFHVGQVLYISRNGEINKNLPWYKKIQDKAIGFMSSLLKLRVDWLRDHYLTSYEIALKKKQ